MPFPSRCSTALLALAALPLSVVLGCDAAGPPPSGAPTAEAAEPIMNGEADTDHPAVVWLFSEQGFACTGTIIAVDGTTGYVLTAAHCADMNVVAITTDYRSCFSDPPGPDCEAVFSVEEQIYHPTWTGELEGNDFSLLRFLGAGASTPVIPAAASDDGVFPSVEVEIVGFGQTETGDNSLRKHKVTTIDSADSELFSHPATVCFGDSGGPAIIDGKVVGVSSFVDSDNCYGHGYSGRVQLVYDDFIEPYITQGPIVPDCDRCLDLALNTRGGPCGEALEACSTDAECAAIESCRASCVGNPGCENDCILQHPTAATLYDAIFRCVSCDVCVDSCGEDARCDAPSPTATVAASSGVPVGLDGSGGAGGASGEGGAGDEDAAAEDDGCAVVTPGAPAPAGAMLLVALGALLARRRRLVGRP